MATFNDHAFFAPETDLLPVWYTHDHENLWDYAFEYSPFFTNENCGFLNSDNASHGCDLDVPSQHYTEHEISAKELRDAYHVASYMMTEGREVVWEIPSASAVDFCGGTLGSFHETREQLLVHNQELSRGEGNEESVKDSEISSDCKNLSDEEEEPNGENEEERDGCFGLEVMDDMSCAEFADFKLPASKSPIMEAMVVCAIKNWGLELHKSSPNQVVFRVTDFERYYKKSRAICSKQHPTEDIGSRVKSLRRWFDNFPKKKDRQDIPNFLLAVKSSGTKKVNEMIERNTHLLGVQKRRRRQ